MFDVHDVSHADPNGPVLPRAIVELTSVVVHPVTVTLRVFVSTLHSRINCIPYGALVDQSPSMVSTTTALVKGFFEDADRNESMSCFWIL